MSEQVPSEQMTCQHGKGGAMGGCKTCAHEYLAQEAELIVARAAAAKVETAWMDKVRQEIELRMACYSADVASAMAHRACCGTEHDPQNGKLHGLCVVCGVPWPCETASYFLRSVK